MRGRQKGSGSQWKKKVVLEPRYSCIFFRGDKPESNGEVSIGRIKANNVEKEHIIFVGLLVAV